MDMMQCTSTKRNIQHLNVAKNTLNTILNPKL